MTERKMNRVIGLIAQASSYLDEACEACEEAGLPVWRDLAGAVNKINDVAALLEDEWVPEEEA